MSYTSACPVLRVSDYERAKAFYIDVLGFAVVEEAGETVTGFGIFQAGAARVFLIAWNGPEAAYDNWRVYLYPENLSDMVTRITATGTAFKGPPVTEYGMREVEVIDPDGNVLCLGEDAG